MGTGLEIRLLGELEVRRDGAPVPLPQSKKTRALLAYLAVQRAPQRRDALCELLWELPDDPRAALRWSLSKLRPLLNDDARERLEADRERVSFTAHGADVDLARLRAACADGVERLGVAELRALEALCRGPFIAGLDLPAQPSFETWRLGQQEQARRLHLCVLDALAAKLADAPGELAQLMRKRIELDPGDEASHARLVSALAQSGALAEAEQQVEASARMLAALGPHDAAALRAALRQPRKSETPAPKPFELDAPLRQEVRFCTARDGVRIAYATVGSGPPLVKCANWLNHLEFDWDSPIWRYPFRALAKDYTFVRYDARGNGLSDWDVSDWSLDALVADLEAVVDAAGLERFPLLGISQGCAVSIEYAVRHPERVTKLILYGGYARGWKLHDDKERVTQNEAHVLLTRTGWGRDNPAYRQLFTSFFIPGATQEQMDWFNELQRITTSPENAATLLDALGTIDVRDRLAHVRTPTLVIHARKDARVTLPNGRELATGIPGARFVILESQNHVLLEQEPAMARFLQELRAFLAE
ncbi:MAG TPA: alpha/beta fold hydrolase [Vitreimonas sp.]|uniref:alpha/beta fold hydrolase n=1 Tax=Vitreimonas sp. TaxID=3069702 RepID=UPI002D68CD64|nr:alpha/beta fold hydrolase [Vitreimonas sp.]HYD88240.1 alpha/beta fold hydrolase [Vitreimonas sp.]